VGPPNPEPGPCRSTSPSRRAITLRLLIVTAVAAERDAILAAAPQVDVLVGGVGPAAAAAATSGRLARRDYDLVVCAGIAGGFAPLPLGSIAVASTIVFADLGAELEPSRDSRESRDSEAFAPLSSLGFGVDAYAVPPALAIDLADTTGGHLGTVLTVATVTGSGARAQAFLQRYPDAVAEAMEGAGVAAAGAVHGLAVAEVRAISNHVGPRDRAAWQIPEALAALGQAVARIAEAELTS
jgi:futalosine hydrolase